MRVIFVKQDKTCIATKDESRTYKDLLYTAFSEREEVLLEGAYYRVTGLLVGLPVEDPPEIRASVAWSRAQVADDYC